MRAEGSVCRVSSQEQGPGPETLAVGLYLMALGKESASERQLRISSKKWYQRNVYLDAEGLGGTFDGFPRGMTAN